MGDCNRALERRIAAMVANIANTLKIKALLQAPQSNINSENSESYMVLSD
jgi:hypothetical protein